ncbi:hypothetical protein H2200_009240 [Cladophialophora chaetospira]|uniref:Acetyl-CoA synthetase-like protein n=1 Tax=Cladophialophora chaetospira TaxID=386627 RepID=A0AA39CFF2_9EURO|nr:hypothetical protein H2200_009240 [Cladophialophora chaetospira]
MSSSSMSFVSGPTTPALWEDTLGGLINRQAINYGDHTAAMFSWQQNHRLSYRDLATRSEAVAKSLLARGLKHGDNIAIMAGNRYEYIQTFLGAARIGCPFVVLNNTYTAKELISALNVTSCKLLFIASNIRLKDLSDHIRAVTMELSSLPCVLLPSTVGTSFDATRLCEYSSFLSEGWKVSIPKLIQAEGLVKNSDVLNLQFTSGTTGAPKAAMLSHKNIINNARLFGNAMKLSSSDIVCCPPPLFHCFGLVMGFLTSFLHGSKIVFPCDQFDADQVVEALHEHRCTVLLGVPTMFITEIEANKAKGLDISSVRLGVAAGSSVAPTLVKQLAREFGIQSVLIAYGMTETSPITFMTSLDDNEDRRSNTVGRVFPHTAAKVIDRNGNIVPRGVRGELCTSGYALQKGYYNNPTKTDEVMKRDSNGTLWMHTGDECVIDDEGYCSVTGRIKDMIIRGEYPGPEFPYLKADLTCSDPGGENIFPHEIETLLSTHPSIAEASVVAIRDARYGEVVGAFLRQHPQPGCITPNINLSADPSVRTLSRPSWTKINGFVRRSLGSHKAPRYVFWIGDEGVDDDFPKTGSGKIMKHVLRDVGERLVKEGKGGPRDVEDVGRRVKARL